MGSQYIVRLVVGGSGKEYVHFHLLNIALLSTDIVCLVRKKKETSQTVRNECTRIILEGLREYKLSCIDYRLIHDCNQQA